MAPRKDSQAVQTTALISKESTCPLDCPDACSLTVDVADNRAVALRGNELNPVTAGFICGKVSRFADHVHGPERILTPLLRQRVNPLLKSTYDSFVPMSWDRALDMVAEQLRSARDTLGGDSILPYSYGGSNGFLTQGVTDERLFRRLGTCRLLRNICASPTEHALMGLYGPMAGMPFEQYANAQLIVLWGVNLHATSIHLAAIVKSARQAGAQLVVVDPRRTPFARSADLHLPVRVGTDVVLALAVHHWLFSNDRADLEFLKRHAVHWEMLRDRASEWTLDRAGEVTGIDASAIEGFARLYADSKPAALRCGWGLERNRNGGSAAASIFALPAVAGKFGVVGGGFTMSNSPAFDLCPEPVIQAKPSPGRVVNMNLLGKALVEENDPPIKVLFVYNSNARDSTPHQNLVLEGLQRGDLFTIVCDSVMTGTARWADVILPTTTFLEHDELKPGYGSMTLTRTRPVIPPVGESRSNHSIFLSLLQRLELASESDIDDVDAIVSAIIRTGSQGEAWEKAIRENDRYVMASHGPQGVNGGYSALPTGKIDLCPTELDQEAPAGLYRFQPDPATEQFPLALISPATSKTISTTFGQLWREQVPIEMASVDAAARGISTGDLVRVSNQLGEVVCKAKVSEEIRAGVACLPKGLWAHHTNNGKTANALCPDSLTDIGQGACFNDARVQIERVSV